MNSDKKKGEKQIGSQRKEGKSRVSWTCKRGRAEESNTPDALMEARKAAARWGQAWAAQVRATKWTARICPFQNGRSWFAQINFFLNLTDFLEI